MSTETFRHYCICGAAMTGSVQPASSAVVLGEAFRQVHSGDGHGTATQQEARRARAKADRRAARLQASVR